MKVRPATPADIPAMLALERHAATAAHWREDDYGRIFAASEGTIHVVLVIEEEQVVGFIVARTIGDEWEIENVAVAGQARRRGLGTRLLGEFLDLARNSGARAVFLEVRESNLAARALYEKWAFVENGRRKGYYRDPEEDALIYKFDFPQAAAESR
ncbi:MAG TPA: ribosomal protein S18-alanine N-acetyltransferase [Candidatus Acidoferrales bacterium]|nr:ribosomal protein S18-alanine N-acetyltransferase [Candidatus Acidoferrales bacterium]